MSNQAADKIDKFFDSFPQKKFEKGEIFLDANTKPYGIYYLKQGAVRQYIVSKEGKELTMHFYTPGSFFPLFWAMNNDLPDYFLQSITATVLHIVPKNQFIDWATRHLCNTWYTVLYADYIS